MYSSMNRRKFLGLASSAAIAALAGCSSNNNDQSPTLTDTTVNPTQTTQSTETSDDDTDVEAPESMTDIARFTANQHNEFIREGPFVLNVTVSSDSDSGDSTQDITYRYDGDTKSFFGMEFSSPDASGTTEQFSTGGLIYVRKNPSDGEVSYSTNRVEDGGVFMLTGINQINQLHGANVTVGEPEQVDGSNYKLKYPITSHADYDTVSGHITLNPQSGLLHEVVFSGESDSETYELSMTFEYHSVSVEAPSWVKNMDDEGE